MARVVACIDGSVYSQSVADHTAWAASHLGASVSILNVAERGLSGYADGTEAQRWLDIEEASARVEAMGVRDVAHEMRGGDLLDALSDLHDDADLIVIGKRGVSADFETLRLGSNLERILRAARRPVLVASRAFRAIRRYMLAFDGRPSARRAVEEVAASPLFRGVPGGLVMAAPDTQENRAALEAAAARLACAGAPPEISIAAGPAMAAIPEAVKRDAADLLVMGAYGHSRLRSMVIGSTTTATIRASMAPILVYR